jgi:hypothetical protein
MDNAGADARLPQEVALELLTQSGQIPYSRWNDFTVTTPEHVCLLDSYEFQFACGDRAWRDTVRFGRKGQGPGEIDGSGTLISGPGGLLGHVALAKRRLTLFSAERRFLRTIPLPAALRPLGGLDADSVLVAAQLSFAHNYSHIVWYSISEDSIVEEREYHLDARLIGKDTVYLSPPQLTPDGAVVFKAGLDHLVWFCREGEHLGAAEVPDFGTVYPSEREVEAQADAILRLDRRIGRPPSTEKIEEFRNQPLGRITRVGPPQVDRADRVWIATTRPSQFGTYLAVFRRAEYLGEIEIAGRLLSFQIADSLLVALVEALEPDEVGLYPRRFDWYRMVER